MNTLASILLQDAAAAQGGVMNIIFIVALIAIFYFFMIRPQQKRQKKIAQFRNELRNGDKVITAGGIHGIIKEIEETAFILEVSKGVVIKVDKGSIYPSAEAAAEDKK